MKISRRVSVLLLVFSAALSIVWGSRLAMTRFGTTDFRAVYYGTRCLLHGHNPYNVSELEGVVRDEHGERPGETFQQHQAVTLYVNLPTTFLFVAPFAMLPYGVAQMLWLALLAVLFPLAGFLVWNLSEGYAPGVSVFLVCMVLANSVIIFSDGNTAGIAIPLCVVGAWCFFRGRFVAAGIVCMALSLAIKPHDSGFVWLYFLLAGGVYRKRAAQSLAVTMALGLTALLWVSLAAPHWAQDWHTNLSVISTHGHINDAGPASVVGFNDLGPVIDLQSVVSVFRDDPRVYNLISYLICGLLLVLWAIATLRTPFSKARAWLALGAVVPLTMLVTYHRPWDAKLLVLTIPACAMLWAEGGRVRWIAVAINTAAIALTSDVPMAILTIFAKDLHISISDFRGQLLTVVLMRRVPLVLLAMGIFYVWVYVLRSVAHRSSMDSEVIEQEHSASATS